MLLDQKKTKRMVKIVSIIAAIGFAGALLPILVLVIIQSDNVAQVDNSAEQIAAARQLTQSPAGQRDPAAWRDLAQELIDGEKASEAIAPARRAITLAPKDFENYKVLVDALTAGAQTDQALQELQKFTKANPRNSEALLSLGNLAFQSGRYPLATLSYQSVLTREGEGSLLADQALQGLAQVEAAQAPATTEETTSTPERTTTGPVTP
jgi:tetratricopeptide (TPR) repeat protein